MYVCLVDLSDKVGAGLRGGSTDKAIVIGRPEVGWCAEQKLEFTLFDPSLKLRLCGLTIISYCP
jgi:hypothetical protein